MQLLLCQYKLQEALAVLQQLLQDVFEAQQAWRASSMSGQSSNTPAEADASISAAAGSGQSGLGSVTAEWSADTAPAPPAAAGIEAAELQQQHPLLQVAMRLAAALTGLMGDVLLAAVRDAGGTAAGCQGPPRLPCIFPTPLHWSKWLKHSEQQVGGNKQVLCKHSHLSGVPCCFMLPAAPTEPHQPC